MNLKNVGIQMYKIIRLLLLLFNDRLLNILNIKIFTDYLDIFTTVIVLDILFCFVII